MLPLHQSKELRASLQSYFQAAYTFRERAVGEAFHGFLADPERGIFKGPYLSVKLPFAKAGSQAEVPLEIKDKYVPYDHQLRAFQRLTTRNGHVPEGTIMTTGTGSGKTESFLYPLLDYCYAERQRPGIKAIVLYPMNALATDQAARFAKAVHSDPKLREAGTTVGLLIGAGKTGGDQERPSSMGRDHVIENRDAILKSPPDILLTNFKMLDYALMRARYQQLWSLNLHDPELLRFLVLDELHTYDGAQGSDVANLIRRLKLKFGFSRGHLCPVGTSATVGDGEEGKQQLSEYAGRVFGETFSDGAIIGEKRLSPDEFFADRNEGLLPDRLILEELQFRREDRYRSYVDRQKAIWGIPADFSPRELAGWIRGSALFRQLIASCGPAPRALSDVLREMARREERFAALDAELQEAIVASLLSVADQARNAEGGALLSIQVQQWIRELSGVVRKVASEPAFSWREPGQTKDGDPTLSLPLWQCRECGGSGWLARKPDNKDQLVADHARIFEGFFAKDKNIWFFNTDKEEHQPIPEYQASEVKRGYLDPVSLNFQNKRAEGLVPVIACRKYTEHRSDHSCPLCNNPGNSISIVGGRAATIASVVTGQILATELDETPDHDRKVLAFTNSVQDAAHQAGFMRARNYRFTFRTALQRVIREANRDLTLEQLLERFVIVWESVFNDSYPNRGTDAYVHQFFPAKKIGKVDPEDYRSPNGKYSRKFLEELALAVRWEAVAEFGYNSTIGRTLEKTRTCAVAVDADRVAGVYPKLRSWLQENVMENIKPEDLGRFVTGLLLRQRQRGAVSHPYLEKYRTEGAKQWNLNYTRDKRHFLNPGYGSRSRFPRPLVTTPINRELPLDTTYGQKENWYHSYFKANFAFVADEAQAINDFYQQLLPLLVTEQLLDVRSGPEGENYCLRPDALVVGGAAGAVQCPVCNVQQTVLEGDDSLVDLPCITYRCAGRYASVITEDNYYQSVYNRRRAPRIYATDHTGLLDRADRERKEVDFRERPHTNSLNTLVATSTLEMGIDIGDLNVTMNTAVPPLPSNFLQRVGRAGRKSGSALIVNLVKSSQSHDLFYYEEPLEMMAGKVHTPGCFLSAREILKRHFLAYLVDSWTALDPVLHKLPGRLGLLKLRPVNITDPEWLPNQLLDYIENSAVDLLASFRVGYLADGIDAETFEALETFVHQGYLKRRVERAFHYVVDEIETLRKQGAYLQEELESGKYGKQDPTYKIYEQQLRGLKAARKKVQDRQTLEHLTNFGLLPNYAFPETGVTMTAQIITPRQREDGTTDYQPLAVEATRSARSAIRELVPGSLFYTQGWQLPVTGINLVDYEETTAEWQYCGNCDHLQRATVYVPGPCPKCGDQSFATPDHRHLISELREVKATAKRDDATIRDNKEERERGQQLLTRHFDFTASESQGAFALVDIPFGVEYCRQVVLREVNAGHQQHRETGRSVTIANKQVNAAGYITCRHCGKSTTHQRKDDRPSQRKEAADYHYPYCKHKEHAYTGEGDDVLKELFLLREMQSEVLKILLPIQEFEREEHITMFMAGLNLGLKHFYGGNPQHITLYGYPEFNSRTNRFDVYLVMLDVIPGGTGYLGKLFTTDNITKLLRLAYDQIRTCSCQDRGKDGCYHCIFSYSTQHYHHALSRLATEQLFRRILEKCGDWVSIPNGLSSVTNTSYIEESELESRFVRLFRTLAARTDSNWTFTEDNVDGTIEYKIACKSKQGHYRYVLQPQVMLGPSQGVRFATRADFVLRLVGGEENGKGISGETVSARPKIPVYTDGWQFHASREHPRFATDVGQRQAILDSGQYVSWTLTYDDVVSAERLLGVDDKRNEGKGWDELAGAYTKKAHDKVAKKIMDVPGKVDSKEFGALEHSVHRLMWWMEHGLDRSQMERACHSFLSAFQSDLASENYGPQAVGAVVAGKARLSAFDPQLQPTRETLALLDGLPPLRDVCFDFLAFAALYGSDLYYRISVKEPPISAAEGYDKETWYYFWRLFNVLQLASPATPEYRQVGEGNAASFTLSVAPAEKDSTSSSAYTPAVVESDEYLEYYDQPYHAILRGAVAASVLVPEALEGSFILTEDGVTVAEAVIGNTEKMIVSGPLGERDARLFTERGYAIVEAADLKLEHL